jgi:hypothetical protein
MKTITHPALPSLNLKQGVASKVGRMYGLPVAANSATGFGDPSSLAHRRPHPKAGAFFVPEVSCYGGCAWETFGSAGFQVPGSPTCAQLPPIIVWRRSVAVPSKLGAPPMHALIPSKIRALAHRRMALSALRADSSLSVRLARYNAHMAIVRTLETVGGVV